MEQWRYAAVALDEFKTVELRALTEARAAKDLLALLEFLDLCHPPEHRRYPDWETSGLIEQQRLFHRRRTPRE